MIAAASGPRRLDRDAARGGGSAIAEARTPVRGQDSRDGRLPARVGRAAQRQIRQARAAAGEIPSRSVVVAGRCALDRATGRPKSWPPSASAACATSWRSSPEDVAAAAQTGTRQARTVREWQVQARLACRVPNLRSLDVKILVACGICEPEDLAQCEALDLLDRVDLFISTSEGQRAIRGGSQPDLDVVTNWIESARHARVAEGGLSRASRLHAGPSARRRACRPTKIGIHADSSGDMLARLVRNRPTPPTVRAWRVSTPAEIAIFVISPRLSLRRSAGWQTAPPEYSPAAARAARADVWAKRTVACPNAGLCRRRNQLGGRNAAWSFAGGYKAGRTESSLTMKISFGCLHAAHELALPPRLRRAAKGSLDIFQEPARRLARRRLVIDGLAGLAVVVISWAMSARKHEFRVFDQLRIEGEFLPVDMDAARRIGQRLDFGGPLHQGVARASAGRRRSAE